MKTTYKIMIAGLLAVLFGCQAEQSLPPLQFVQWVENPSNGLLSEQTKNNWILRLQYKPIEYVIAVQERKQRLLKEEFDRLKHPMDGLQYFTLTITEEVTGKKNSRQSPDENIAYLAFEMQRDLMLVEGNDSLRCQLFHFENNHSLTSAKTFLLGFDLASDTTMVSSKKLVFKDRYFGTGPVEMHISNTALAGIPRLKLHQQ